MDARSENFGDVITWLRDLQKEFPEADIKTEILFYEPSLFYDRRHLGASGANKFTKLVAKDVLAALGRSK